MLRKVFGKLLWKRKRDYFRVILSGAFVIATVFLSSSVAACLVYVMRKEEPDMSHLLVEIEKEFLIPYIFLLLLMFFILVGYIRKRSADYAMLTVMGIQRKHRFRFIGAEYFGIIAGSLLGGIALGKMGSYIVKHILEGVFSDVVQEIYMGSAPLKMTLIIGILLFGFGFILCDELVSCMGIDYVVAGGNKSGKAIHMSRFFSCLPVFLMAVSFGMLVTYWGRLGYVIPTAVSVAALVLFSLFWGGATCRA